MASLRDALATRAAVDTRALAALRVGLGATMLVDLALRARSLRAFYTDAGVLPVGALREAFPAVSRLSLHALSGGLAAQVALFVAAGVAAVALCIGYRTRLALLVSWLLLVSLHARNPMVLNAGDSLLRRLMFWSLFLPLGARWAADAREDAQERVATVASAALLGQVVVVYAVNAVLKLRGDAWLKGTAVGQVLALDQFTVFAGDALAGQSALLAAATWGWLALVCAAPLLLLARPGRVRGAVAVAFALAHVGMALTLRLGIFPLVSLVALLPFLPPSVWNAVDRRTVTLRARLADVGRPRPSALVPDRRVTRAALAALAAGLLVWNAATLGLMPTPAPGESLAPADNAWDMFAPEPPAVEGWLVAPSTTAAGDRVDAWVGGPLDRDRPPDLAAATPTARWRKYLNDAWRADGADAAHLASYLCTRWERTRDATLERVALFYVTGRPGADVGDRTRERWGQWDCP